ncbi:hypothetical protein JHK82_056947 [Glycine max]|nr:hypothetical protein JHK87_057055 [Glycine soja]KAG5078252.1 hypothetical protein JHK82_056947 [Glycine max]KHN01037.1 hypothetical protein glysoja_000705 [Glycine soja]
MTINDFQENNKQQGSNIEQKIQHRSTRNSFPKENDEPLRNLSLHVNGDHRVSLLSATPFILSRRLIPTESKGERNHITTANHENSKQTQ